MDNALSFLMNNVLEEVKQLHTTVQTVLEKRGPFTEDLMQTVLAVITDAGNCLSLAIENSNVERVAAQIGNTLYERTLHSYIELREQCEKPVPASELSEQIES